MVKLALCKNANISQGEFEKNLRTAYSYMYNCFGKEHSSQISGNLSNTIYIVVKKLDPDEELIKELKDILLEFYFDQPLREKPINRAIDELMVSKRQFVSMSQLARYYYIEKLKNRYPNVETLSEKEIAILKLSPEFSTPESYAGILKKLTGKDLTFEGFEEDKSLMAVLERAREEVVGVQDTFKLISQFAYSARFQRDNADAIKLLKDSFCDRKTCDRAIEMLRKYYLSNSKIFGKEKGLAETCAAPDITPLDFKTIARPIVLLPRDYTNDVVVHELMHVASISNTKDYDNVKIGIEGGELKKLNALNEVLTEYFSQQITSQMEKDGNLIGSPDKFDVLYQVAFPYVFNIIKKYESEFKKGYITDEQDYAAKTFGKENLLLLNGALAKVLGTIGEDTSVIDKLKDDILKNLTEEKIKEIGNVDKFAYEQIFAMIERRIDKHVSGEKRHEEAKEEL